VLITSIVAMANIIEDRTCAPNVQISAINVIISLDSVISANGTSSHQ
jgi:hypothetical protein